LGEKFGAKKRISRKFEKSDFFVFTPKPLPIPDFRLHHWKERENTTKNK